MSSTLALERHDRRVLWLKAALLSVWAALSFGVCFFARELQFQVGPWPVGYWIASQGALLGFIAIVAIYAWAMERLDPPSKASGPDGPGA